MTHWNRLPIALGCLLFCVTSAQLAKFAQSQELTIEAPKVSKPLQSPTSKIKSVQQVDDLMARMTLEEKNRTIESAQSRRRSGDRYDGQ